MTAVVLEICAFSLEAALLAFNSGADRIELCDAPQIGGSTPPLDWLEKLSPDQLKRTAVMIRPAHNGFICSESELNDMVRSIAHIKSAFEVEAFVFGVLDANGEIAVSSNKQLIEASGSTKTVFHRAFDVVPDPLKSIKILADCGFSRLLCGRKMSELVQLKKAAGNSLTVMPGGGIRSGNIGAYIQAGFTEIHSSARISETCHEPDTEEIRLLLKACQN